MGAELSYFFAGGHSFRVFRNLRFKAWNRIVNLLQRRISYLHLIFGMVVGSCSPVHQQR